MFVTGRRRGPLICILGVLLDLFLLLNIYSRSSLALSRKALILTYHWANLVSNTEVKKSCFIDMMKKNKICKCLDVTLAKKHISWTWNLLLFYLGAHSKQVKIYFFSTTNQQQEVNKNLIASSIYVHLMLARERSNIRLMASADRDNNDRSSSSFFWMDQSKIHWPESTFSRQQRLQMNRHHYQKIDPNKK
jgi:hypothetical protein